MKKQLFRKGPYDDVQFIWNDFKRQNYTTGYIEDAPKYALFNYLALGYDETDGYPRPYCLYIKNGQSNVFHRFCYKQMPEVLIIYWLKQIK
uniref:Uncharacterized protein n=1 Tax=Tetranychus urticae TaxID=32264 RepID=T1KAW2_TETUR